MSDQAQDDNAALPDRMSPPPASRIVDRFIDWMYLPPAHLSLLRRLTALACLPIGFLIWHWTRGGPGPYVIPAWRYHQLLFVPPLPPPFITNGIFILTVLALVWIVAGTQRKWVIALPILVGVYFGCRDFWAIGSHFVIMLWTYLVALLFAKPGKNCSRRLVQISIFFCYFLSAVQKTLSPDFMSGYSIEAEMADGWAFNSFWKPILHFQSVPHIFWQAFSWMTILLEYFLAFGLMSKRFRRAALWLGVLFHIGIAALLDLYIFWFSVAMLVGYVAFLPIKEKETEPAVNPSEGAYHYPCGTTELILASAVVALMMLVPLRIYVAPERNLNEVVMLDRTPWSFCMFLQRLDDQHVGIKYKSADGRWHDVPLESWWRTKGAVTDNELYSICTWAMHHFPDATEVEATTEFSVNRRWHQHKSVRATRDGCAPVQVKNTP